MRSGNYIVAIILAAGLGIGLLTLTFQNYERSAPSVSAPRVLARTATPVNESLPKTIADLKALDNSFAELAKFAAPAVVHIKTETARSQNRQGGMVPPMMGQGSGFIFRSDGYIITNDHVVKGAGTVTVVFADGREVTGKVIRATQDNEDVAVVKVDMKDLPTLAMADSDKVLPGQMTMAIGSPFGLENTVTYGHVSAIGRGAPIMDSSMPMMQRFYSELIQTDAAINQGNSGGPLLNVDGQVIGVNTAIFSAMGGSNGVGFALPANHVAFIADILISKGNLKRAMMGVIPENLLPYEKEKLKISAGAKVASVSSNGPAAVAGIKANDIITKVGTFEVKGEQDLRNAMLVNPAGQNVTVEYIRDGGKKTASVKLSEFQPIVASIPSRPESMEDMLKQFQERRPQGGDEGNSLKIPSMPNQDPSDVQPLREGKARLGVGIDELTAENRAQYNVAAAIKGVVVMRVEAGSTAAKIGIQAGDVIQSLNGTEVNSVKQLTDLVSKFNFGQKSKVKFARFGSGTAMNIERDFTF